MTDKKESIINVALELFATDGFNAVSTSRIAKQAGVSEGLIFKHFENKKGLLQAIMDDGEQKVYQAFSTILLEEDPRQTILRTVEMPFGIDHSDYNYWRLLFKFKWQEEFNNPDKMKPMIDKLSWAFKKLGYKDPAMEAELLNQVIEGISVGILRDGKKQQEKMKSFLMKKYGK